MADTLDDKPRKTLTAYSAGSLARFAAKMRPKVPSPSNSPNWYKDFWPETLAANRNTSDGGQGPEDSESKQPTDGPEADVVTLTMLGAASSAATILTEAARNATSSSLKGVSCHWFLET